MEFQIRLSGNSSSRQRTDSVNAGVIMLVSYITDFRDICLEDPCMDLLRLT